MRKIDSLRFTIQKEHHYDVDALSVSVNKTLIEVSNILGGISWLEQAQSKKDALQKEILLSDKSVKNIIIKKWDNNANLGCDFTLWSIQDCIEIGFRIGVSNNCKVIDNNIFIALPLLQLYATSVIIDEIKGIIYSEWIVTEFEILYQ